MVLVDGSPHCEVVRADPQLQQQKIKPHNELMSARLVMGLCHHGSTEPLSVQDPDLGFTLARLTKQKLKSFQSLLK